MSAARAGHGLTGREASLALCSAEHAAPAPPCVLAGRCCTGTQRWEWINVQTRQARLDQVIRLADGRVLGYAEYGPVAGPPLFLFHGLPGSRLAVRGNVAGGTQ